MNGRDWVSAMLEAMRRRRSIAAEAFRATLAEFPGVLVQVEPLTHRRCWSHRSRERGVSRGLR